MSLTGKWTEREAIYDHHPYKLTQEQKTKCRTFSLLSVNETMRTHGHVEGNSTHWGLPEGGGGRKERSRQNNYWVLD